MPIYENTLSVPYLGVAAASLVKSSSLGYSAPGIYIPAGSLDRWRTKRNASASALAEVVVFGDSTTYGQTATGNTTNSANNYTYVSKLRELSIAAGYGDGGVGLVTFNDPASLTGRDALVPVASNTGFTAGGVYGMLYNYGPSGATIGNTITFQFKGTILRTFYVTQASGGGTMTRTVNGGSPTTLNCQSGTAVRTITADVVTGLPGGGATNTVVYTVNGTGICEFTVEAVNATGIVFHRHGNPGQTLATRIDYTSGSANWQGIGVPLGLGAGVATNSGEVFAAAVTGPRVPALAILNESVNEQINASSQADAINKAQAVQSAVGIFAETCRTAGVDALVCLPHFLYATNARNYMGLFRAALVAACRSYCLPWLDLQYALGGMAQQTTYGGGVHLNQLGYDTQASFIWNNALAL